MQPYPVDVSDIVNELGESIVLDDDVSLDTIEAHDTRFEPVRPAHVSGLLTNAGDGVVLTGQMQASLRTECSRCLTPFTLDISADLEGLYTTPDKATELPEDQEWEPLPHDGIVDILPAALAALLLELPMAPLHAPDCQGICPTCGADLNESECDCASATPDDGPFAALRSLLPDESGEIPTDD